MYFLVRLMYNVYFLFLIKRSVMFVVCLFYLFDFNFILFLKKNFLKYDCMMCKFLKLNVIKGYCKKILIFEDFFK